MKQKTALYIALGITTFVLVALGSVALAWPTLQQSAAAQTEPTTQAMPALDANVDPQTLLATVQARDAAYQAQIEQANQQLQQAYQRVQELQSQNQLLLEREQLYRQRLQESAQIIEAITQPQSTQPPIAFSEQSHDDHESFEHADND